MAKPAVSAGTCRSGIRARRLMADPPPRTPAADPTLTCDDRWEVLGMSVTMPSGSLTEDTIIERLFSAGLDVHTALRLVGDTPTATLLHEAIDRLDRVVRQVRLEALDRRSQLEPQPVAPVH